MIMPRTPPTIALINSNEDTTEMLRICFQQAGFPSVVVAHVPEIKRGETDFGRFLDHHDPRVIVWDIMIPYDENWAFAQRMIGTDRMKGRAVVLTTTNQRALESIVGPTSTQEIIGKPYDIERVVESVRQAVAALEET